MRCLLNFASVLLVFLSITARLEGSTSITLSWDANADADIAGYHVYYGGTADQFIQLLDVPSGTTAAVSNLSPGGTYFFVVTAYSSLGIESLFSNLVSYNVPAADPTPTPTPGDSPTPTPTPTPVDSPTPTPTPVITPTPTPTPTLVNKNFSNISTRANVQSGDGVVIGGFIIDGDTPKRVVIRALGPSLSAAGITGTLSNPTLVLHSSTGAEIGSNDDWRTGADAATIAALGLAPADDSESAILATLSPGVYTTVIAGANGGSGIALLEAYDTELSGSRIVNISTRSKVGTGNNIMIGGFIINGTQSTKVLVRALGPSLARAGITGALSDPTLDLYNGNGSRIYTNDNWKKSQKSQILATGLAPTDDRESAILATLPPGNYTAMVRGMKNTSGVALVEVYTIGN